MFTVLSVRIVSIAIITALCMGAQASKQPACEGESEINNLCKPVNDTVVHVLIKHSLLFDNTDLVL